MSNAPHTYRRRLGRAPSPPTWLWYEQIPFDDDEDDSSDSCSGESDEDIDDDEFGSCSEDGEDYAARERAAARGASGQGGDAHSESGASDNAVHPPQPNANDDSTHGDETHMEVDSAAPGSTGDQEAGGDCDRAGTKKDVKGKQRAVEPTTGTSEEERTKRRERERARRKKQREPSIYSLRPILTIQKSQGFVWNQVCLIRYYLREKNAIDSSMFFECRIYSSRRTSRIAVSLHTLFLSAIIMLTIFGQFRLSPYSECVDIASTSPPNGSGCLAAPASAFNAHNDYEVDVVEIRVKEGEFADIIP